MRALGFGLIGLFGLATASLAGDGGGGGDEQVSFDTPSHNMCCTYTPEDGTAVYSTPDDLAEMSCDRVEPSYWHVALSASGKLRVNKHPGEVPGCGNADVLGYGEVRRDGPFKCVSKTSGITCTVNGKGFSLAKSGLKKIN